MAKSFAEAFNNSTDAIQKIYDHHQEWQRGASDLLLFGGVKVTDALHHVTMSGQKYRDAANMQLQFSSNSHAAIVGAYRDNQPEHEQITQNAYNGAKETYDHLNAHLDAIGALAQSHAYSIGVNHPLTEHIVEGYKKKQKLIGRYAKAWGFQDRFDFDDIMKNNNLNPDQFK